MWQVSRAKAEKEWDVERKGGLNLDDLTDLPLRSPIVTVMVRRQRQNTLMTNDSFIPSENEPTTNTSIS